MLKAIIGYTGFVGSNLDRQCRFHFRFNSSNINQIIGKSFSLLVIAAPYGVKWKANQQPEEDLENVINLINILKKVKVKHLIQISTIDVYKNPILVDEDTKIDSCQLLPYSRHRFLLEKFVRNNFENHLVIRLPSLFGLGLKKNFIYDLLHLTPEVIGADQFIQLTKKIKDRQDLALWRKSFLLKKDGNFFLNKRLNRKEKTKLIKILDGLNFNSLVFTNKNSIFQLYYLNNLWKDLQLATKNKLSLVNFTAEPIKASELAKTIFNINLDKATNNPPVIYNVKTKYAKIFGGSNGYLYTKQQVFQQLRNYLKSIKYEASYF